MSTWRALLLRIGDKCPEYAGSSDHKDHIDTCFGILWRELENSKEEILELLVQCAEQLPHKIPFYSVLVGLINLEDEGFAKRIIETTQYYLQEAIYSGNCNKIRIFLRFLTGLVCSKVILPSSMIELFETLLSSAAATFDKDVGNPCWQSRADFYTTCILSSLPWGGAELIEQVPDEFDKLLAGVQSYMSIRRHRHDIGFLTFELDHDEAASRKDFLEDLWDRVQMLSKNGWKTASVPRPHLQFEAQLVAGKSYNLSAVSCPQQPEPLQSSSTILQGKEKHDADLEYPRRLHRLNIFPSSKAEANMHPIDRFVLEEYLLDVLFFFNGCRKECAYYMVGLPVNFRYDYLMAETVFSQLLLLPQSPFKPIYYTLVIIDLCKALPGAFPTVVVEAVRALFERIADLDMECRTRLILWFSHHLANFQYLWPWEEWAHVRGLPRWAPQRVFVQEVLEREVRLSYWDKIKQSIENASALEELLPPREVSNFKYSREDGSRSSEDRALSRDLNGLVKGRKTAREIISWIDESVSPTHGSKVALEVTIQTLLDIGSKSFTHLITVLERYGQVIVKLCPDQDHQVLLLDEVNSYWKNNTQMTAIAIDRMMGYRLVSNLSIILRNAISKTYNRITDLRKDIVQLQKSVLSAEAATVSAKDELEAAESKVEVVDGEPVPIEKPGRLKRLKGYVDRAENELVSLKESLEAKEGLLTQALEENKALFILLYTRFRDVLTERLPPVSADGRLPNLRTSDTDAMVLDSERSTMDVEKGDEQNNESQANGVTNEYKVGEKEQWCLCTLGYVKAFSRLYASEIWPHVDSLEAEVFIEGVHPLILRAFKIGLDQFNEL